MVRASAARAIAAAIALTTTAFFCDAAPHVDAGVHRMLRQQGSANIFVTMQHGTQAVLDGILESSRAQGGGRGAKIHELVDSLEAHAAQSQKEVLDLLAQEAAESSEPLFASKRTFWISNQIYFHKASPKLISKLAQVNAIKSISPEEVYPLPKLLPSKANATLMDAPAVEWGVERIQAPAVWQKGFTGEGVVVGSIDTGVRASHEALASNFRGEYGWFDAANMEPEPYDLAAHGTHTMGTIAGANGIGVAPGATWMTCKYCRADGCYQPEVLACMEFMTCPTDPWGNNRDCSKAPHLVSNSWSGGRNNQAFVAAIDAWEAAGIIPIFAIGNDGPNCDTASAPGDYLKVIGVGATTIDDALADFSSKGPAQPSGYVKPDVSAPGLDIRSSINSGDSDYASFSGTSMAAPHVAGAVALILQVRPGTVAQHVNAALVFTAETQSLQPLAPGQCGNNPNDQMPNNGYGFGRINVLRAVEMAQSWPTA